MKHIFILNPLAGNKKLRQKLKEEIMSIKAEDPEKFEIYITQYAGDAKKFTANYRPGTDARFYAIGGDGTLNEVANGILLRRGYSELGLIPCGTGDDFVRVFPEKEPFLDLQRQLQGKAIPIDAIKTDARNGINMINIGVDAQTAADVHRFSRFLPGPMAYTVSLINRVVRKMGIKMKITVDDEIILNETFILASAANGVACGGGFHSAPKAKIDDGFLEITAVRPLTKLQFAAMVKGYKNGTHLDDPRYAPYLIYLQGKKVTFEMEKATEICIDGEIICTNRLTVEILPKALNFIIPK